MKIIIKRYSIVLLTICALLLGRIYAYAQDAETRAQVEFIAGQGPTTPVHPEDPDTEENVDPVDGSLAIIKVSDFYFGSATVKAIDWLYDIDTGLPNIQVVDLRGTGAGWKVSANISSFRKVRIEEDPESGENVEVLGEESLPGASIFIYDGRPKSKSTSPPPVQSKDVELTTDAEYVRMITAPQKAGTGLWVMRWYPPLAGPPERAYVQLYVPAGSASLGTHKATVNWVLENTPSGM